MNKIVVLTGAGISRESGLKTFRDEDGLWAGYRIEDVCTPEALARHPERVLEFYNLRRREAAAAEPNAAHFALARLQEFADVRIVTQNVDGLHERAGSLHVHHLHGEVFKARSSADFDLVQEVRGDILLGDLAADGTQLRPHICFFGEAPYGWMEAVDQVMASDRVLVVGTSLQVYPAAGLVDMARGRPITLVDPNPPPVAPGVVVIAEPASVGVPAWVDRFIREG